MSSFKKVVIHFKRLCHRAISLFCTVMPFVSAKFVEFMITFGFLVYVVEGSTLLLC